MKNTVKLLTLIIALILVLGGAYILYDKLSAGRGQNLETLPVVGDLSGETVPVPKTAEKTEEAPKDSTPPAASQTAPLPQTEASSEERTQEAAEPSAAPESTEKAAESGAADTVPDFTVHDAAGEAVRLSDFFGKPIILNFWASWCGPCREEMPALQAAYEEYGEEIRFVFINLTDGESETQKSAEAFLRDQGYTFPVWFDLRQDAALTYGVYSIPTTFFIDENGVGIARAVGSMSAETLQRGIGMIYSREDPGSVPESR